MDSTAINVLIAEDDVMIANDISSLLQSKGYLVAGIAHNYKKAVHLLNKQDIDFAILDIRMESELTGVEIAKHINTHQKIPFVFLTSFSDQETLNAAQEQSPYGYLVKPYQEATLLSTISLSIHNFNKSREKIDLKKVNNILTKSELKVCELLCTSMTYDEIADHLFVSKNTVRFHAKNIYFKLDMRSRSELLNYLLD